MIILSLAHRALNKECGRYDGLPSFPYYRATDLGMEEERFFFPSRKGVILSGSRYFSKGKTPKALVIFFHGLSDGRASYLKEISVLVKAGYLVYAYDNTGCMLSNGRNIVSCDHTHYDQEYFFKWLENDSKSKGLARYAVGHSWGGYGAMVSAKNPYKIEKIVSLAGYNSLLDEYMFLIPKKMRILKPWVWLDLLIRAGKYANIKASSVLAKSKAKVLYIQGEDDKIVGVKQGYWPLNKRFVGDPRFKFVLILKKGHSILKTKKAEDYINKLLKEGIASTKATRNIEMDIEKATELDENIVKTILAFLDSK